MDFIRELLSFLRIRKKLWLAPIIIIMLIVGGLLIIAYVLGSYVFIRLAVVAPVYRGN